MLLLIRFAANARIKKEPSFTFHYASTYTNPTGYIPPIHIHLHSTMLLLIQSDLRKQCVFRRNLHSTMLLLIQKLPHKVKKCILHLHSTMLLLIRFPAVAAPHSPADLHSTMLLLIHGQGWS